MIEKEKKETQDQRRIRLKKQERSRIVSNTNQLINNFHSKLEQVTFNFIPEQKDIVGLDRPNIFPYNQSIVGDNKSIDRKSFEYEFKARVLKRANQIKNQRIAFEQNRLQKVSTQADQKRLEKDQQIEANFQMRQFTLNQTSLSGGEGLQHLNLGQCRYIIVQSLDQYRKMFDERQRMMDALIKLKEEDKKVYTKGFFDNLKNLFKNDANEKKLEQEIAQVVGEVKNEIAQLVDSSFLLLQPWYKKQVFPYRIICIFKEDTVKVFNFCIYSKQNASSISKIGAVEQPLDKYSAFSLRNRLVFAKFANKNKQKVEQVSTQFEKNTRQKLAANILVSNIMLEQVMKPERVVDLKKKQSLKSMKKENVLEFVRQWKQKSYEIDKRSSNYLYIEPTYVEIPKTHLCKSIRLSINKSKESEIFKFDKQTDSSFIFRPVQQKVWLMQNLDKYNNSIEFLCQIENQANQSNSFTNKTSLSNVYNESNWFSYAVALLPDSNSLKLIPDKHKGDFPYILAFESGVIKTPNKLAVPQSLQEIRQTRILSRVGQIPIMYSTIYSYPYNPKIHPIVSQILSGTPTITNQQNFQKTYFQFVNFMQGQDNKSQNYCEYLKLKKVRSIQGSGFVMSDRYSKYCRQMGQEMGNVQEKWKIVEKQHGNFDSDQLKRESIIIKQSLKKTKNGNADKIQQLLRNYGKYLYVDMKTDNQNKITEMNNSIIKIANNVIQIYERSDHTRGSNKNLEELTVFFITFMKYMYPYNDYVSLKEHLLQLRLVVQKYLPQFNYQLNRIGIGLENYASAYLLQLFASLPIELCLRIWDFLIVNLIKVHHARIFSLFTIMSYQQKSNLTPIFPINQLIESMEINNLKFKLDTSGYYKLQRLMKDHDSPFNQRQVKISNLAKKKYIRKFIFGTVETNITKDQMDFPRAQQQVAAQPQAKNRVHSKLLSLKQLSYPLPDPGYQGYEIDKIYLFISGVFLLNNINLHSRSYTFQINLEEGTQIKQFYVPQKSFFQNLFIQFDYSLSERGRGSYVSRKPLPVVEFRLFEHANKNYSLGLQASNSKFLDASKASLKSSVQKQQIMIGKLNLDCYYKDVAYRQNVVLEKSKESQGQLNNLGISMVSLCVVLKSKKQSNIDLSSIEEQQKKFDEYSEKALDFDLSIENNEAVRAMSKIDKRFKKLMDPLDELDVQKYKRLRISTSFTPKIAEWIKNSSVSIQELRAIFAFVFSEESQKQTRLDFPKFYQYYSSNFQKFQLGKFLLQLILMADLNATKKLSMIYCTGVHYQNITQSSRTQEMSVQTCNSIINQIMRSSGFLNACPFANQYFGNITYACFYQKGNKVDENKRDITEILQDWAYICRVKAKYDGVILGSVQDLSVLRALLPINILKTIEMESLCRFQIHYQVGQQIFVWSATVNTNDFSIQKRGVKFLNSYPKYMSNPQQLTSIAETMYNTENVLPLQQNKTIDYRQFVDLFKKRPLLQYLLHYNERLVKKEDVKKQQHLLVYEVQKYIESHDRSYKQLSNHLAINQQQKQQNNMEYNDFAVFRYQNSMPAWIRCRIVKDDGQARAIVKFQNKQGLYLVPRFQIISMDEVQINNQSIYFSELSQSLR